MGDQVKLTVQLGLDRHLGVLISVADCQQLLKLRRGDSHVFAAELGPAARAAGDELELRRAYRGATIPGYRFGRVYVHDAGSTAIVPTPPRDGVMVIEVSGPCFEDW